MGKNTKIDWCTASWNPVTGCYHNCEYCYARKIAERFRMNLNAEVSGELPEGEIMYTQDGRTLTVLEEPYRTVTHRSNGDKMERVERVEPYPSGFMPTYHRYRLKELDSWKKPQIIFVCSMADLFGEWVPDEVIEEILAACRAHPQHKYLFLTKNPRRYDRLEDAGIILDTDTNFWLGSTVTDECKDELHWSCVMHTFQSCEPMLAPWPPAGEPNEKFRGAWPEWVIFGAETGNRKGKIIPEKEWVDNAVKMCRNIGAAVFMKESLREIMGDDFIQEFPECLSVMEAPK